MASTDAPVARPRPNPPVGRPKIPEGAPRSPPRPWGRWLAQAGVLVVAVAVFLVLGTLRVFNLPFVLAHFPEGFGPALVSLELTTIAFAIGFVLAMPLGLVRAYGPGAWPRRTDRPWPFLVQAVAAVGFLEFVVAAVLAFGLLGLYPIDPLERLVGHPGEVAGTSVTLAGLAAAVGLGAVLLARVVRARARLPRPTAAATEATPTSRVPLSARRSGASADARDVGSVLRWPFYGFATGYVTAIRGTPFLVQMFIVYYAIIFAYPRFQFLGIAVPFWAGLIALAINTTAYQAEALRGGFQSVERSQIEAARALGFGAWATFVHITLPQSLRLVTLPLSNEWISTFKTSTILSYISVVELYFWARSDIAYQLARPIEAFVIVALFYLAVNVTISRSVSYVERRYRIPGLGSMAPELPGLRGFLGGRT